MYLVIKLDVDKDVEADVAHVQEFVRETLRDNGPIRAVRDATLSDLLWADVVDGVADYAGEVHDDISTPALARAKDALEAERDNILAESSHSWLEGWWDGDPPAECVNEIQKVILAADKAEFE